MSPTRMPALSAGLPASTLATMHPGVLRHPEVGAQLGRQPVRPTPR